MVRKWLQWLCPNHWQQVADFCRGRSRQPDQQFLDECGLPPDDPEAARIALAVRRAVAQIGLIDSQFIRADDVYPDQLGALPLWDSMDWAAFTWALEDQLGQRFVEPGEVIAGDRVSVKQMAADVYRILNSRANTEAAAAPDRRP